MIENIRPAEAVPFLVFRKDLLTGEKNFSQPVNYKAGAVYYKYNDEGIFEFTPLTKHSIECHLSFKSARNVVKACAEMEEVLKEFEIKQLLTYVPEKCGHIHKLMERIGFSEKFRLEQGTEFFGECQDLIIYTKRI